MQVASKTCRGESKENLMVVELLGRSGSSPPASNRGAARTPSVAGNLGRLASPPPPPSPVPPDPSSTASALRTLSAISIAISAEVAGPCRPPASRIGSRHAGRARAAPDRPCRHRAARSASPPESCARPLRPAARAARPRCPSAWRPTSSAMVIAHAGNRSTWP